MAWEYLSTEPFDERYKVVARYLPAELEVLDLNCGNPRFKNFYKYKKYTANDVFVPNDTAGIEFLHCKDEQVDVPADVMTLFGYGGGEFTGEPLESKEAGNTLVRLAKKYHPKYIVIEMTQKWEEDFKIMTALTERLDEYEVVLDKKIEIEPANHYHDKRFIRIFMKS